MTNEALIVNQAHKIADLEIEKNQYKDWYYKASEEITELRKEINPLKLELNDSQKEIQQLQIKLNGSENTL